MSMKTTGLVVFVYSKNKNHLTKEITRYQALGLKLAEEYTESGKTLEEPIYVASLYKSVKVKNFRFVLEYATALG